MRYLPFNSYTFEIKMFFAYVLASILAVSVVFGGPAKVDLPKMELVYEGIDVQREKEQVTAIIGDAQRDNAAVNDRSSNLKYVFTLQKSSIWDEIKQKTLTIKTQVDGKMIERRPESLSDQELEQLKRACHDGLKCVAVDQLIVLKTVKEPSNDDGKTAAVLTAITKITKVITEYTTEYHEDTYQYSEVTEADDPSKVYQSVTTILEDNKDLCSIDAVSFESSTTNYDRATNPKTEAASKNDIERNYGTINNYHVNKDTVNMANIIFLPSNDEKTDKNIPKPVPSNGNDSLKNVTQENIVQGKELKNSPPTARQDKSNKVHSNVDTQKSNTTQDTTRTGNQINERESKAHDARQNDDHDITSQDNPEDNKKTINSNTSISSDAKAPTDDNHNRTNSVNIENPGGLGNNNSSTDIASSGSSNQHNVKKGHVLNGNLNNGTMKVYNHNYGVITDGEINDSKADNGTINIGTINEGPITYTTTNDTSNNKKTLQLNNINMLQYANNLREIYSNMLKDFSKK